MCVNFKDASVNTRNGTEKLDDDVKCKEEAYCPKGYACRNQVWGNYWCFNATIARTPFHNDISRNRDTIPGPWARNSCPGECKTRPKSEPSGQKVCRRTGTQFGQVGLKLVLPGSGFWPG